MTGTVKWFNDRKGYGFITPDEGDTDIFVHHSGIQAEMSSALQDGQRVEFDIGKGHKGPTAVSVKTL